MQIDVISQSLTNEEQLDMARLLVKAGYRVWITKGETVNRRAIRYINFERVREDEGKHKLADDSACK